MRTLVGLTIALAVALSGVYAFSPRSVPQLAATRIPVDKMQLNSIARTSAGLVTAGELGTILVSTDEGANWRRANVSTDRQALITRLVFADDRIGIALGHEGWILRTTDGGLNWVEVAFSEKNGEPLMSAARLPSGDWLAVGAFGRTLRSSDDGKSWDEFAIGEQEDWHLNAIAASRDKKTWLIVGEAGTMQRSTDGGQQWTKVPAFYNGSLYGAADLGDGRWVAYGMRGNVFHSVDNGATWTPSRMQVPISTYSHAIGPDATLLLVGQGGIALASADGGASFSVVRKGGREALTDLIAFGDGKWLLTSDSGLQSWSPTAPASPKNAS